MKLANRSYWVVSTNNSQQSKFGFIKRVKNRWHAYIVYWYSTTPDDIDSFVRRYVRLVGAYRTAGDARSVVNLNAFNWMYYLLLNTTKQIIFMYPRKKIHLFIRKNNKLKDQVRALYSQSDGKLIPKTPTSVLTMQVDTTNICNSAAGSACHGEHGDGGAAAPPQTGE